MRRYLIARSSALLLTLCLLTVVVYALLLLIPGDVVQMIIGAEAEHISPEFVAERRRFFGLDLPWYHQYWRWAGPLLRGDLGLSWRTGKPVAELIRDRLPVTVELTLLSVGLALVCGVTAGVVSALYRDRLADNLARLGSLFGLSIPVFWQGTMLILLCSLALRWMPPVVWTPLWVDPWANLQIMALPVLCLATASAANLQRVTRSCMLEVLSSEYVRTAHAKGWSAAQVIGKHALKNAFIPIVTVVGLQLGYLLGGLVVIEEVFTLPGVGRLVLWAIYQRDYPVVLGTILFIGFAFMLINLLVDVLYAVLDPRIRYRDAP
jgi:peptide/nickel transport system permease protein